ncbi:MAG: Gfo/Idh/MocA family protein [Candidatus Asgardarchaeia archaeon]
MEKVNVGILGYGWMATVHAYSYKVLPMFFELDLPRPVIYAVCGRNEKKASVFMKRYDVKKYYKDWKEFAADENIEIVHNCLSNDLHVDPCIEALKNGKHIVVEKPLASNLEDAKRLLQASKKYSSSKSTVRLNYRFNPSAQLFKKLIEEDFVGDIIQFRAIFAKMSHTYPGRKFTWRDVWSSSGGGPLMDLGVHLADIARFLVGEVDEVAALSENFIKERPYPDDPKKKGKVEIEDIGIALLKFRNGAVGSIEATKISTGYSSWVQIDVHGTKGGISWRNADPFFLYVYSTENKNEWKKIAAPFPYRMYGIDWTVSHVLATHYFLKCILNDEEPSPSIEDGVKAQAIIETAYRAAKEKKWLKVSY